MYNYFQKTLHPRIGQQKTANSKHLLEVRCLKPNNRKLGHWRSFLKQKPAKWLAFQNPTPLIQQSFFFLSTDIIGLTFFFPALGLRSSCCIMNNQPPGCRWFFKPLTLLHSWISAAKSKVQQKQLQPGGWLFVRDCLSHVLLYGKCSQKIRSHGSDGKFTKVKMTHHTWSCSSTNHQLWPVAQLLQ